MQQTRPRTRPEPPPRLPARPAPKRRTAPPFLRGRLYDVIAAGTRVGVGWVFAEYGLALRGGEDVVAERLSGAGTPAASLVAPVLPAVLVALAVAFAVGLLTWLTGPLLALAAVAGTFAATAADPSPFGSWGATALVTAVCVLMAVGGGRWSWDHLVLSPRSRVSHQVRRRTPSIARGKASAFSPRRPEHAPPLLYPVEQAAPRRPNRL
ncbi:DoxX family protein [Nocardiopsis sp. SBT366]|uniref:DoxX family protein n=1 Tax=Nocardiopsis sp. SBT366 TaxID=1580529 RepID=UPI00066D5851|nr:DoxX family protein [Nocardiopsis sp. SBT366]